MKTLQGVSVSKGIAIGRARIIEKAQLNISRAKIEDHEVDSELNRFSKSVNYVIEEIEQLVLEVSHSEENKDILNTHMMILQDPEFHNSIDSKIRNELLSLEQAINEHFVKVVDLFKNMDSSYMQLRSSDYEDVAHRLLSFILKQRKDIFENLPADSIIFMDSITPSEVTQLIRKDFQALGLVKGSMNSHSSIIARSMNLPAVVGLKDVMCELNEGDLVVLDAYEGKLIIDPDETIIKTYRQKIALEEDRKSKLKQIIDLKTVTKNGREIKLLSNIEIPEELETVLKTNCDGIGLFRTEFLFMDRDDLPSEEEQFKIYKEIARKLAGKELVIRTIDVGGDKSSEHLQFGKETNPNLGCRGIRISLLKPDLFKMQLKAIYRAAVYGNIKIMFPMISSLDELHKIKTIISECQSEMQEAAVVFKKEIPLGVMIEVPAAALSSHALATECDFLSIGTNDLIQYTLAVDRENFKVAEYYNPYNPAILQLIKLTTDNAHKENIPVSVCGDLASNPDYAKVLIGLKVDQLSVSPGMLLEIKNTILKMNTIEADSLVERLLTISSPKLIEEEVKKG